MIRKRYLIKKDQLFDWVNNPEIVKIILNVNKNKRLHNDSLCDVHVYYYVDKNVIYNILGSCKVTINRDRLKSFLSGADHAYLNGIQSLKQYTFLSESMINKLREIETKYSISLNISKEIINILNKNNEKKS